MPYHPTIKKAYICHVKYHEFERKHTLPLWNERTDIFPFSYFVSAVWSLTTVSEGDCNSNISGRTHVDSSEFLVGHQFYPTDLFGAFALRLNALWYEKTILHSIHCIHGMGRDTRFWSMQTCYYVNNLLHFYRYGDLNVARVTKIHTIATKRNRLRFCVSLMIHVLGILNKFRTTKLLLIYE